MVASVRDLGTFLGLYLPPSLPLYQGLELVGTLDALQPLFRLHQNQRREPRQPLRTAWTRVIKELLVGVLDDPIAQALDENAIANDEELAQNITDDLEGIYDLLGIDIEAPIRQSIIPVIPKVLISQRLYSVVCPPDEHHTLRGRIQLQNVRVLDKDYQWRRGTLFVSHCPRCRSDYYPDRYTFANGREGRRMRLEVKPVYFRVSKSGVWVHSTIGKAQEYAINRFHAGWSNFTSWINDSLLEKPSLTNRQITRLFLEHFSRRLLIAHNQFDAFVCEADPSSALFAETLRNIIGVDGGRIPDSLEHGCIECTHRKRYRADLIAEGAELDDGAAAQVADMPGGEEVNHPPNLLGINANVLLQQQMMQPEEDQLRGYVRMAVMDGKMIGHKICALDTCNKPLTNYKTGRFCEDHNHLRHICGFIPCGRPTSTNASVTCNNPEHEAWHAQYLRRFTRLSFPGVQRVLRRQQNLQDRQCLPPGAPLLRVEQQLPNLGDIPGNEVSHTFRAQTVYCLQTVQWACGVPIGWGKCYRSESSPQVLAILKALWHGHDQLRPGFVAYDDACDLLRHVVTQDPQDSWLRSTKFIVDAWHYIGHRATDALCRLWCNPAPSNGSQPDLIMVQHDDNGRAHLTRAFNTETAEQLNSWLDGFESQLRQMSAVNFDIYVHALMLIYKEAVEERIRQKENELPDDFWDEQ